MQSVLVVDDDPSVRELISVILEVEGFTVWTAGSGREALAVLADHDADLVTVDLSLPEMDGWELCRQLRESSGSAHCRIMLVTGSSDPELRERAALADVDLVLEKPFDFATFAEALHRLVDQPRVVPREHRYAALLDRIIRERLITPLFQPIVDLETGCVVGVEGLARGPEGPLHNPGPLFDVAHQLGRLHELDNLCRIQAISAARDAKCATPPLVFVNAEPGTIHLPMDDELRSLLTEDLPFQVVVEFTERALTRRVPALLRHAEEIRSRRNAVALDDLGVDPRSVAVLPLVQPEIAKLDMSLLAPTLSDSAVTTAVAVAAYAEHSGAIVVAEGIENEQQRATAMSLGAHWGQGFLFGRPAPLSALSSLRISRQRPVLQKRAPVDPAVTPFELALASGRRPRRATGLTVLGISRHLELQARKIGNVGVAMVALQHVENLAGPSAGVYADICRDGGVVGFLGTGVSPEPLPCAYGVDLPEWDLLRNEWVIVVLGPHHAGTLVARDLGDDCVRDDRRYDFVLSHDRAFAASVARMLARRLTPRVAIPRTTALS